MVLEMSDIDFGASFQKAVEGKATKKVRLDESADNCLSFSQLNISRPQIRPIYVLFSLQVL